MLENFNSKPQTQKAGLKKVVMITGWFIIYTLTKDGLLLLLDNE